MDIKNEVDELFSVLSVYFKLCFGLELDMHILFDNDEDGDSCFLIQFYHKANLRVFASVYKNNIEEIILSYGFSPNRIVKKMDDFMSAILHIRQNMSLFDDILKDYSVE